MGSDGLAKTLSASYVNFMSDKQVALETIQRMPETASLDEITRRLEFLAAVQKGLDQIERGDVVPHERVKKELAAWLSK
jgi:predicted transcriptional regulator